MFSAHVGFWWKAWHCSFSPLSQQRRTCWLPHRTLARTSRSLWSRSTVLFHLAAVSMKDPNTSGCCSRPCLYSCLGPSVFFGRIAKTSRRNRTEYYLERNQAFYMLTKEMKHRLDTVTSLDCGEDPALRTLSLCLTADTVEANKTKPFVRSFRLGQTLITNMLLLQKRAFSGTPNKTWK